MTHRNFLVLVIITILMASYGVYSYYAGYSYGERNLMSATCSGGSFQDFTSLNFIEVKGFQSFRNSCEEERKQRLKKQKEKKDNLATVAAKQIGMAAICSEDPSITTEQRSALDRMTIAQIRWINQNYKAKYERGILMNKSHEHTKAMKTKFGDTLYELQCPALYEALKQ